MTHRAEDAPPQPFELSGGALCLDFANTWGNRLDPGSDRLRDYGHLLVFARQSAYLSEDLAAALDVAATSSEKSATAAFSLALELRNVVYRVFSSGAGGREVPHEDVEWVNALLGDALSHRTLERRDGTYVWSWTEMGVDDFRYPIWPIIESTAKLLTSGDMESVRECKAEDCNWLFLDRSRARNRRWCSMSTCGNRAKARRYYRQKRES